MKYTNTHSRQGSRQGGKKHARDVFATAPYNFIPFNRTLKVPGPARDTEKLYSGRIVCSLEAVTPLFIGGHSAGKNKGDGPVDRQFLTIGGKYAIPGSSIKGMLRELVEIISCSQLTQLSDRRIAYRRVGQPNTGSYKSQFINLEPEETGIDGEAIGGGYLVKRGADYYFKPCDVYICNKGTVPYENDEVINTGHMDGKKVEYHFDKSSMGDAIKLKYEVVMDFLSQMDDSKDQIAKWRTEKSKLSGEGVPLFSVEDPKDQDNILAIGFARYFRIQYKHSPKYLAKFKNPIPNDFCTNLFGYVSSGKEEQDESALRGRVSIGTVSIDGKPDHPYDLILQEPHASCIRHYIRQNTSMNPEARRNDDNIHDYNMDNSLLSGRKYYWHRSLDDGTETRKQSNDNKKIVSVIHPLKAGAKAVFEIHVDRLTETELGALFEALELPQEEGNRHYHKLGGAKPYGFGTVKITVQEACVQDVAERYSSLRARLDGNDDSKLDAVKRQEFREKFKKYISDETGKAYSTLDFNRALEAMTAWDRRPENRKTRYMGLKSEGDSGPANFSDKALLPPAALINTYIK